MFDEREKSIQCKIKALSSLYRGAIEVSDVLVWALTDGVQIRGYAYLDPGTTATFLETYYFSQDASVTVNVDSIPAHQIPAGDAPRFFRRVDYVPQAVGDMVETPFLVTGEETQLALGGPANRQGRLAADHMCGRDVAWRGNAGTSVVRVFDLTVGDKVHDWEYITMNPPNHTTYYPGSTQITTKVAFEIPGIKLLWTLGPGQENRRNRHGHAGRHDH